jgi:hypothetical protein
MALLIAAPIGGFTLLEVPSHVSLTDKVIIDHGYGLGKPQIYRYDAARKLTIIEGFRVKDGSLTSRAGIVIDFDGDGDGLQQIQEISKSRLTLHCWTF